MPFRISSLEAYKFIFMLALFAAQGMLLFRLQKRESYPLRLLFSLVIYLAAAALYPSGAATAWSNSLMFGCFFILSVFLSLFCYDISWNSCLFCCVAGYSVQHLASILYNMIITLGGFSQSASVYSTSPASFRPVEMLIFLEVYLLVYVAMHYIFIRRVGRHEDLSITSPFLFVLVLLMLVVEIVLNSLTISRQNAVSDLTYFVCVSVYNLLCTLCVLMIMFGQILRKNLQNELEVVRQLRRQEKRQYNISKETIDMINVKCHDMKHQIHEIRHSGTITSEALKEVEKSIGFYDAIVKTGCDALDVILAEKAFFCQKNSITINCIVDGEKLRFIKETDIYSLFGNLLDNAIHSVMKLEPEKRVISLAVKSHGKLLSVNSHNYYEGDLRMDKGVPRTTSGDTSVHGFGVRSMMMTVKKYGGTISFKAENGVFNVNILFNLADQEGTGKGAAV